MKILAGLFILSLVLNFTERLYKKKLIYKVREVNIDTANFKTMDFNINDLSFLIEVQNVENKDIRLKDFNRIQFHASIKSKINLSFVTNTYITPTYLKNGLNYDLNIPKQNKIFFLVGISCFEFVKQRDYLHLNKKEKLKYLMSVINDIELSSEYGAIPFDKINTKILYRTLYYPHDPEKYYPLKPNAIILKN